MEKYNYMDKKIIAIGAVALLLGIIFYFVSRKHEVTPVVETPTVAEVPVNVPAGETVPVTTVPPVTATPTTPVTQ